MTQSRRQSLTGGGVCAGGAPAAAVAGVPRDDPDGPAVRGGVVAECGSGRAGHSRAGGGPLWAEDLLCLAASLPASVCGEDAARGRVRPVCTPLHPAQPADTHPFTSTPCPSMPYPFALHPSTPLPPLRHPVLHPHSITPPLHPLTPHHHTAPPLANEAG